MRWDLGEKSQKGVAYINSRKKMVTENTELDFIHVGHHNYLVIPQAKIIESLGKKKKN